MELTAPRGRPTSPGGEGRVNFSTNNPDKTEDSLQPLPQQMISKAQKKTKLKGGGPRMNAFTNLVERTIDGLRGDSDNSSYEELRRQLATIRKQYDEVRVEAGRRERELVDVRHDVRGMEAEAEYVPEFLPNSHLSRDDVLGSIADIDGQIDHALETKMVYTHMVERLKRELKIIHEKIGKMDTHLKRKSHEVEKRQELSRRVHRDKVEGLNQLETMEQEIELERMVCSAGLDDLDSTLQQRKSEVRHKEDFERWRYEVAMEAATEAFHATAGRFRKIYAIEKLTGNCLQKIIFEQAEENQTTEEGFQKIREVTGLQDVMDIVHKFLNRDSEHEQLKASVREAEVRLHSLREEDSNRQADSSNLLTLDASGVQPLGLSQLVAEQEHALDKAHRENEMLRGQLRREDMLFENIKQWSQRMSISLSSFDPDMDPIEAHQGVMPYFANLVDTVDRFMTYAHQDMPTAKLAKMTTQATSKEYAEQQRLLTDKEFNRANCRVPASLDPKPAGVGKQQSKAQNAHEEERYELEVQNMTHERERLKLESRSKVVEKDAKGGRILRGRHGWGRDDDDIMPKAGDTLPPVGGKARPPSAQHSKAGSRPTSAVARPASAKSAAAGGGLAAVRGSATPR